MNPWIIRIVILILALVLLPVLVEGVAHLTTQAIDAAGAGINNLLSPLYRGGGNRTEGVIKLCLYLIAGTMLVKFLLSGRR